MNTETVKPANVSESELDQPIWSVVSFERTEAAGLIYAAAAEKIAELEKQHVSGLCIVTEAAAARVGAD
ncbi:MAG TPA: hypothetical protein VEV84_00105 [Pyrinomonadaceae bacterium]|nr:hypothetical protein [Pyrinomonadaceae bacterium]